MVKCTETNVICRYFAAPECIYLTLGSIDFVAEGFLEGLEKNHLFVGEVGRWDCLPDDGWKRWDTMPNEKEYLGGGGGSVGVR